MTTMECACWMNTEGLIIFFFADNKLCVSGHFQYTVPAQPKSEKYTIQFGHEFPRIPAFTASIKGIGSKRTSSTGEYLYVNEWNGGTVTKSSAAVELYTSGHHKWMKVAWMACLWIETHLNKNTVRLGWLQFLCFLLSNKTVSSNFRSRYEICDHQENLFVNISNPISKS